MKLLFVIQFVFLLQQAFCLSSTGSRLLLVVDKSEENSAEKVYSKLLTRLKDHAFSVTVKPASDISIIEYGERLYDHLILFTPETSKWPTNTIYQQIVDFVNDGGNLLMTSSPNSKQPLRDLAEEFGFELLEPSSGLVVDYFNYDKDLDGKHGSMQSVLSLKKGGNDNFLNEKLLYQGSAHRLTTDNPLVFSLISAERSAAVLSSTSKKTKNFGSLAGKDLKLVSALQARNNARVVLSSSLSMFSDEFIKAGNENFVNELLSWCFQESKVIRVKSIKHFSRKDKQKKEVYRIKDKFAYQVNIEEYKNEKWVPFKLPSNDKLQLEFVMLDPYIRTNLFPSKNTPGLFETSTDLKLPDHHGVFTLKLEYKRRGFSYIIEKTVVSIVPFRHNEYERFLTVAYPYYTSAASMIVSFVVFCMFYLYGSYLDKIDRKKSN